MNPFHVFASRAAQGDLDGPPNQRGNQFAFVISRSAHVGMWIGGRARRFGRSGYGLVIDTSAAQSRFRFAGTDCGEADAAKSDGGVFADPILDRELYGGAGGGINRSRALECNV